MAPTPPQYARYTPHAPAAVAEGWRLEQLTRPSRLYGANGLRNAGDGRIFVAQVNGSQISAVDIETGAVEAISPMGGGIVGPDDLALDDLGNIYAAEITMSRVSVLAPNGRTRVLRDDIRAANPITFHQGRLIAGELQQDGRILELDLNGGEPRVIAADVPVPNAFEVGPDGLLYFPVMAANQIWRVSLDGGQPEVVARDLGVPDAVKFDSKGRIVSTQSRSGEVLRIDPRTGVREVLATLAPGLDNLTFVGERLFISSMFGQIDEILDDGRTRSVVPRGFTWPLGLALGHDGVLHVADGSFVYALEPGGAPRFAGMLHRPGFPGYAVGLAARGPGELAVTTGTGRVALWRPAAGESQVLAQGFGRLSGVDAKPGGAVVFAEPEAGRVLSVRGEAVAEVLAAGLSEPMGVAVADDGGCFISECQGGRIVKAAGGRTETVLDGLQAPQGLFLRGERLYVVDALAKELVEFDVASGRRRTLAGGLPVGAPPGVTAKRHGPIIGLLSPPAPFADITGGPDGALYLSADAEGSVLMLRPA